MPRPAAKPLKHRAAAVCRRTWQGPLIALCAATASQAVAAPGARGLALQASPALQAAEALAQLGGSGPLVTRPYGSLQALFAKGTVNGSELITELVALRTLMRSKRAVGAVGALLGAADPAGHGGGFDPKGEVLKLALKAGEETVKLYVSSIGFNALDLHLRTMTEDPQLLSGESITLPPERGLSQAQAQRVVNMAAIVVATRVTGKVLRKAQADFAHVEDDYTRLIERREAAARLLFEILLKGADGKAEIDGLYGDDDLRYLRDSGARLSVKDFANDLGAQNLALRHLRQSDPGAWADYKARSDGALSSTKGYIRTTAGVTAFAALLANFSQETLGALRNRKGAEITTALPFAWEFIKEVPPLLKLSWQVGAAGIIELPMKASRRFRVVEGAASEELKSAAEVFAAIKKRNAEPLFNESLFRSGSDGLLYRLYRCDKSEVGRMLDMAVPMAEREKFAADHALAETARFSFANAFNAPAPSVREQELGDELLRKDHRERSESRALGEAQRAATRGSARWNSDQLLRLILANREGEAALATLQLGEVLVRPVPSMQSVYAYESLIDECGKQLGGGSAAARTAPAGTAPTAPTAPTPAPRPAGRPGAPKTK